MGWGSIDNVFEKADGYWTSQAGREAIFEVEGQRYLAMQCREHILYRRADRPDDDCTLAVPCLFKHAENVDAPTPLRYPEAVFREQVREGQSRRFALYDCMALRGVAVLLFAPNGSGTFYDYYGATERPYDMPARGVFLPGGGFATPKEWQRTPFPRGYDYRGYEGPDKVEFKWNGSAYGIPAPADILTCTWETLLPLCEEVMTQQAQFRMRDPYPIRAETPDIPLAFDCGSREELEYVTRCICHADAALFADERRRDYYVQYRSTTPCLNNGFYEPVGYLKDRVKGGLAEAGQRLCRLAFAHNTFHGGFWKLNVNQFGSRRAGCHVEAIQINVCVLRPSAHERAEALLTLHDWLEGKVTDAERRALLDI